MRSVKNPFDKPPLTFLEQVDLLKSRGMRFKDFSRAKRYLSHLNYYRLSAYWLPFEKAHAPCAFKAGVEFNTILEHYIFDRELRLLVVDTVERIEVSLRTQWAYYLSHAYGPHAHLDKELHKLRDKNWDHKKNIKKLRKTVKKSKEKFIRHFEQYREELL